MDQNRIEFIYRKCLTNTATDEERHEFMRLIRLPEHKETAKTILLASFYENQRDVNFDDISAEAMIDAILLSDKNLATPTADFKSAASSLSKSPYSEDKDFSIVSPAPRIHSLKTAWFRYAAVLLLIAGTATFLYLNNQPQKQLALQTTVGKSDILPGGNKATLTLGDGSTIILDSAAANGNLANQGNTRILQLNAGSLTYHTNERARPATGQILYNRVATPKGGQYQITLPDGTKVWLNAASSIHFPATFGKDRTVEIAGEAYLEVAPDKKKPFIVKTDQLAIQVLGTSFNVNAYPGEPALKVSLAAGSVKINHTLLKPGQAYMAGKIVPTDIGQDMAWRNGVFNFNELNLDQVMRQVANWYDVNVIYEPGIRNVKFWGEMDRGLTLVQLLKILNSMGVHFRLEEGRRIIITP